MSDEARTLRIQFATEDAFRSEYESNIANGGIFIATRSTFAVREPVSVEIELGYSGENLTLEGEVVHVVPVEMAETGATPGVAVQFDQGGSELRDRLNRLASGVEAYDERLMRSGRRAAPRTLARVPAELQISDQVQLSGRTRNLSTSGVLISADGAPVPIGQRVRITLTHPVTRESFDVEAHVARHLVNDAGEVTAFGLQFDVPDAERPNLARFVSEVKTSEHSRRLGGISGSLSELGIENLLQMFGTCSPQGTLTVSCGSEEGRVVFASGELHLATVGALEGPKALARMLTWREGSFDFQARLEESDTHGSPVSLEAAILDAMRVVDEDRHGGIETDAPSGMLEDLEAPSSDSFGIDLDVDVDVDIASDSHSGADVQWELDDDELSDPGAPLDPDSVLVAGSQAPSEGLSTLEEAILDLARVGMTVGKIADIIPEPADALRDAIGSLTSRGLLHVER